jgi:hypothetical protein
MKIAKQQTNSVALSPQANYTDWATSTCRWNLLPTLVDRGVSRGQCGGTPTVFNLSFLDRSRYFSFKQPLIYSHKGWVEPVPDPLLLRKSGSAGNRIRDLWVSSQKLWLLDHRGGQWKLQHIEIFHILLSNISNRGDSTFWGVMPQSLVNRTQYIKVMWCLSSQVYCLMLLNSQNKYWLFQQLRYPTAVYNTCCFPVWWEQYLSIMLDKSVLQRTNYYF